MNNEKMEKKVGILTFQNTTNYGAHLQAYALCETIRRMGFKCEIIDYRCPNIQDSYRVRVRCNSLDASLKSLLSYPFIKKRKTEFNKYLENCLSKRHFTRKNINEAGTMYDIFVVGSDQVWNTSLTGNDLTYLLDFAGQAKKTSYAASFGKTSLTDDQKATFTTWLSKFDYISVREQNSVKMIRELCDRDPIQVIDPVFLLKREEWSLQMKGKTVHTDKEKYVLVYAQGRPTFGIEFAKKLAEREHCSVKVVHNYVRGYSGVENIRSASVEKFLSLLESATHVVTTSFHGIAMSLILGKSVFFEINHNEHNTNERIISLAQLFHIESREIKSDELLVIDKMDYEEIRKIIERERDRALTMLSDTILTDEVDVI